MDALFAVKTAIQGCSLVTDNPDVAMAFVSYIADHMTASEFLGAVRNVAPDFLDKAVQITNLCARGGA